MTHFNCDKISFFTCTSAYSSQNDDFHPLVEFVLCFAPKEVLLFLSFYKPVKMGIYGKHNLMTFQTSSIGMST